MHASEGREKRWYDENSVGVRGEDAWSVAVSTKPNPHYLGGRKKRRLLGEFR